MGEGITIHAYRYAYRRGREVVEDLPYVEIEEAWIPRTQQPPPVIRSDANVPMTRKSFRWGRATWFRPADVGSFREELQAMIPMFAARGLTEAVDELQSAIALTEKVGALGLGILVSAP